MAEPPKKKRRTPRLKKKTPISKLSKTERLKMRNILHGGNHGGRDGHIKIYDPDVHPAGVIAYFRKAYEALEEAERIRTERGDVKYVQAPVRLPTLAGYAIEAGVTPETLWDWSQRYEEFGEAKRLVKAMQEHILVNLGLSGGYNPNATNFVLKNLLGWKDKTEHEHKAAVNLHFDAEDEEL